MNVLFHVQYAVLFEIVIMHDYCSSGHLDKYHITPTPECRKLMRQYKLLSKMIDNRFVVLVEVENGLLKAPFDKSLRFTFSLQIPDPFFSNYTNLQLFNYPQKVFYFSNTANHNRIASTVPLTQPIPAYKSGKNVIAGDMVNYNNTVYEAIIDNPPQAPQPASKEWISYNKDSQPAYCTPLDWVQLLSPTTLQNEYPKFDGELVHQVDASICPSKVINGNLFGLNGLYAHKINKEFQTVYISSYLAQEHPLGIIEIFHNAQLPPNNAFIDLSQKLLSPIYSIAFKNRSTWWRYILRGKNAEKIFDKDDKYHFIKVNDQEFVSEVPIPLCQKPIKSLALNLQGIGTVSTLPNPTTQQLIPQNGKLFSNIYLNY